MKKILYFSALISILAYINAFAAGSGNCLQSLRATTEHLGVGVGFEYEYTDQRMNKLDNTGSAAAEMEIRSFNLLYGKLIIGFSDYFNLYFKIGSGNYDLKFDKRQHRDLKMEIELDNGVYTGTGINTLFPIMEIKDVTLSLGGDIQSNFFHNHIKRITLGNEVASSADGSFYGVNGQNSIYLACKYDIEPIKTSLIPYVGGYHSWILVGSAESLSYDTAHTGHVAEKDYQANYDFASFGLLLGMDADIMEYANLNVEGRFIGETGITVGATIKF